MKYTCLFFFIQLTGMIQLHIFTSSEENSVNPDQLASEKPADLDPHCFLNTCRIYLGSAG